jgi:hypothetical protein
MKKKRSLYCLIIGILSLFCACEKESMKGLEKTPEDVGNANINPNIYDGYFLYGSNMAWHNSGNWRDEDIADILIGNQNRGWEGVGANSLRPALPHNFVETWGYDNRVGAFKYYSDQGAKHNVIFIGDNPSERYRDGNSQSYKNLYEPIWIENENGKVVNENNYYAWYVYNVITRYKDYVKFWEIKNEPDFTWSNNGWDTQSPDSWWKKDPSPNELSNWGASIQSYIRLLRISYEVIKSVDPEAFICVGGIGYDSFLDAILRNTDNPDGGKVTNKYPHTGGAWFDCLSFHIYPMYSLRNWGNNDRRNSDAAVAAVENQTNTYLELLKKYGYGNEYPTKEMIITETNVPSRQIGDFIGSEQAQRNYLIKVAVIGQKNQIRGIYPFSVWDDREPNQSGDHYHFMGFYKPLPNMPVGALRINDSGIAWRTVSRMLHERKYDAAETSKLALPAGIEGGAFHSTRTNDYVYVLWAKTSSDLSETASAAFTFPASFRANRLNVTSWNGTNSVINGASINLTGSPVFVKCVN